MKGVRIKNWMLVFILSCFSTALWSQNEVRAALDSNLILIGDQMKVHLNVKHRPGTKVEEAAVKALGSVENLEVLDAGKWDTLGTNGQVILQKKFTITVWDSGYYKLPPIPVFFNQNGRIDTLKTNDLLLTVSSFMLTDSTALAPIKNIIEEPAKLEDYYLHIGIALTLLLLGGLIYFLRHRKKMESIPPPPEIIIPAHELAFGKLDELKKAKLWQQGKVKLYHTELTHILREYLENRFQFHALESTTDEIVKMMKPIEIEEELKNQLRQLFQNADLVKFAKAEPPASLHDQMMKVAENFVLKTKKKIEIPEEEADEATDSENA